MCNFSFDKMWSVNPRLHGILLRIYIYIFAECDKGYFGGVCDKPCPPGSFGLMCGGKCFPKCSKEVCNHVSGCPNNIQYTSTQIHTGIYKRTWSFCRFYINVRPL